MTKLYPSLMCIDFSSLDKELNLLNQTQIAGYHLDVMDGIFVENFALSANDIQAIATLSSKPLEVHLMGAQSDKQITPLLKLKIQRLSFHVESSLNPINNIRRLQKHQIQPGIVFNPETHWQDYQHLLSEVDFVTIMSVHPGFAGQAYLESTDEKVKSLIRYRKIHQLSFTIQVDGAISKERLSTLREYGVEEFVLGTSALFNQPNSYSTIIDQLIKEDSL